jgi:hypothetical protein
METKMRNMLILADDLVLCRSDTGDGGWSLHAPGSTDDDIASGDAPYLVSGPASSSNGDWDRPNEADYRAAAEKLAPWAAEVIPCDGGYQAFESAQDAKNWKAQV